MKRNRTISDKTLRAREHIPPERNVDADLSPVARYDTREDRRFLIPLERKPRIIVRPKVEPKRSVLHATRVLKVALDKAKRADSDAFAAALELAARNAAAIAEHNKRAAEGADAKAARALRERISQ